MAPVEPAWMGALRAAARAKFDAMPWPTTSDEEWRRTDISRLELSSFAAPVPPKPACPREADAGAWAGVIRFEGTRCTEVGIGPAATEKGVRLLPFDLALEEFEAPLHRALHGALERADNRFIPWHVATLSHGAFLWVPAGVEIAEPFLIELAERGTRTASAPFIEVILGEGARASVVHRVRGEAPAAGGAAAAGSAAGATAAAAGGAAGATPAGATARPGPARLLCNAAVDLHLGDASALRFCEVQQLGSDALYFRHSHAHVGRDASFKHFDAQFGSRLAKTRLDCELAGAGAEAVLDGAYYCARGQHMDLRTVQNHVSPRATSRAYYKGAVASGGRSVFQGLIEVATGASGTDAFLTNRNLVLGEAARSDSIPTLRIGNNDVKCSHGSTTGRLSQDELFYLESRGLPPVDAREMLVIGYFEDLLTPTPESFREDALSIIRGRLREAA